MDDLEAVRQDFVADVTEYVDEVKRAAGDAVKFAAANEEASASLGGLRDHAAEAGSALGDLFRHSDEVIAAQHGLRDSALEAGAALGHERDNALGAAGAVRRLKDAEQDRAGLLSRLGGAIGGKWQAAGGLGGIADSAGQGLSGMSIPLVGNLWGLAAALAAISAAAPLIGALLTGLTAGGIGLASFGAVAVSNYSTATTAANQVQAAQIAYNAAIEHGAKHAAAYRTEQVAISKAYAQLSPQQVQLSQQIGNAQNAWQSFVQSNTSGVSQILTQGIGLLPQVFKIMQQFITPVEQALGPILATIGNFMKGPDFQNLMSFLASLAGPVITAIASGLAGLMPTIIYMFEMFSRKDVINAINIAFRLLGFALLVLVGTMKGAMLWWDQTTAALHDSAHWFDEARHWVAMLGHDVAWWFDQMRHVTMSWGHDLAHAFDEARHTVATWAHDVAHWFDDVRHGIAQLAHDIATWFDRIRHDIAHWADDVVAFFRNLPHRMLTALGNLGTLLWNAGVSIIGGLVRGLESAVPGLHSALSWVSSLIPSWKGPLEADAQMLVPHGMAIMQGLMRGIASQLPALRAQLAGVTGTIGGLPLPGGGYGAAGAAGAARGALSVTVTIAPGAGSIADTRWLQGLQPVIQEAVLRYNLSNPTNGLALGGRI